jgi:hypothetical protein
VSIWDNWNTNNPSFMNPATKPATQPSTPDRDPFGLSGNAPDERPWWQRLGELQTPASAPASAPSAPTSQQTTEPTSTPTSEQTIEPTSAPTSEQTSVDEAVVDASAEERKNRAGDKARQMMTRSFTHTEDFDDFLFGTPPEELAVIRAEYDQMVADAKSADPTSPLTPFGTRFGDFTKDDERWSRMATVDQEKISESVTAIFNACDGMGTDENTIISNLRGKSPDEIKEIERVFAATYPGTNLRSFLDDDMDGDYSTEATALIDGDEVTAAAIGLRNAMWGLGTDEAKIEEILRGIPDDQREKVLAAFEEGCFYGSFESELHDEMDLPGEGSMFEGLKALSKGEDATGDAYLIDHELNGGVFGWTGDAETKRVETLLEQSSDAAGIASAFATLGGTPLATEMDSELHGPDRDVMTALMDTKSTAEEKEAKIATARIMRGLGAADGELDKGTVLDELSNTQGAARERLLAELQSNAGYKALVEAAMSLSAEERNDKASFLLSFNAIQSPKADENAGVFTAALQGDLDKGSIDAAKNALAGMTKEQIDAQPELVAKLVDEVAGSGREELEVQQLLLGKPEGDPASVMAELHRREQESYTWERGDGSWFVDMFSDAGAHLDERHARSEARFDTLMEDGATEADATEFDHELGYTNAARSSYGTRKDEIADTTASVVGTAALAAGTFATGGLLSLVAPYLGTFGTAALGNAAVISNMGGALLGGGASMIAKSAIKDDAYGDDEYRKDWAMTLVNMAAAGISQTKTLDALANGNAATKGAATGLAAGLGQGVVNTIDSGEFDAGAIAVSTLGQMAGGAIGNVVGGKLEAAILPDADKAGIWKLLGAKSAAGFGGGMVGGAAQGAMDPGSYDGDVGAFLTKVGLSGVGGALGNVAQGLAEGFGLSGEKTIDHMDLRATAAAVVPRIPPKAPLAPDAPLTDAEVASLLWPPGMGP